MTKTKTKVDDLNEYQLDFWLCVAESMGYDDAEFHAQEQMIDWNFVGKIIKRDKNYGIIPDATANSFLAYWLDTNIQEKKYKCRASESLKAIKLCIIKKKYGEYIEE